MNKNMNYKIKNTVLYICMAMFTCPLFAQKSDLTSAILSFRKQDLNAAKSYIDAAQEKLDGEGVLKTKDLSKFYHNKGLIYYLLFEENKDLDLLNTSAQAFKSDTELEGSTFAKKSKVELTRCAIAFNNEAYNRYESKDFVNAMILFEKVCEINSYKAIGMVDTSNLYNASLMAVQSKDSEKIIELTLKLIELDSTNGDYHLTLIKEYTRIENNQERLNAINRGRNLAPEHTGLIFEEVNYYIANNDNEGLLLSLEAAIKAAPDNKILHFAKGTALSTLKKFEESKEAYLEAIAIDSNYFDAYNNLGSLYLDQAAPLVDKMNNLGLSQADQKKYNSLKRQRNNFYLEAKPYLEEAVRIDNTAIPVLNALKEVCYQTDDLDCWRITNNRIKELNN